MTQRETQLMEGARARRARLAAAALGLGASLLGGLHADDTSIYVTNPVTVTSDVLFTLDTSGSMTNTVDGSGQTRLQAVTEATNDLVSSLGNLNFGLQSFHYHLGGPINFPVSALDSAPDFPGEDLAVARVGASTDDAEEAEGVVTLDDELLDMTQVSTLFEAGDLRETWVSVPAQHEEEDDDWVQGQGNLNNHERDGLLVGNQWVAIRFRDVDVPKNAAILSAQIVLTAHPKEPAKPGTRTRVRSLDLDDAPPFDGLDNIQDFVRNNVGDASVPWSNIFELAPGEETRTPNLRDIVQPIVTRSGWEAGNNLTIAFEPGDQLRTFEPYGNPISPDAPVLRVVWAPPGVSHQAVAVAAPEDDAEERTASGAVSLNDDRLGLARENGQDQALGVRFEGLDIPPFSTILWADVQFTVRDAGSEYQGEAGFEVDVEARPQPPTFTDNDGDITSRSGIDPGPVAWPEVLRPDEHEPLLTPDLSGPASAVIDRGAWQQGDPLVFLLRDAAGGGARSLCSRDGTDNSSGCPEEASAPVLNIWYAPGSLQANQTVGLRFDNVSVPQGAAIESAHLELHVGAQSTASRQLEIRVEDSANAATYSTEQNDITARSYGPSEQWDTAADPWDTVGEVKQSPDIAALVSHVTSKAEWCGNNALAFKITSADAHVIADAWERSPATAPVLRVEFDTAGLQAGEGCVKRTTVVPIKSGTEDIQQEPDGDMRFSDQRLDLDGTLRTGLRFSNVQVPLGAEVTAANLFFTAFETGSQNLGRSEIDIDVQQHPNPPKFTTELLDLDSRTDDNVGEDRQAPGMDVDPVRWVERTQWQEGDLYSPVDDGVDLGPLIERIIDGTVELETGEVDGVPVTERWAAGNALVFRVVRDNSDPRSVASIENLEQELAKGPPVLRIDWQANLGDVDLPPVTTRDSITQAINDIHPRGFTPTVDALFEAATYFSGGLSYTRGDAGFSGVGAVHFGRTRGGGMSYEEPPQPTEDNDLDPALVDNGRKWQDSPSELLRDAELSRLSHPGSYTAPEGSVFRQGSCRQSNPSHPDCRNEHILNDRDAEYISPFADPQECEKGFLVLLSDGIANRNSSRDLIRDAFTTDRVCDLDIPTIDDNGDPVMASGRFTTREPAGAEMCGLEVAEHLYESDFIGADPSADIRNNVTTFTIGFDLPLEDPANRQAIEFLKALAFVGNGGQVPDNDQEADVAYGDGFFTASNAVELRTVFDAIFAEIQERVTSFTAPGLGVNALNRLFNRDDVYFSLFSPRETAAWQGNIKKFKLCTDQAGCELGQVIDRNGDRAVNEDANNLEAFGTLRGGAAGFWSEGGDSAPAVDEGGAGAAIPDYPERNVYVNTAAAKPAPDTGSGAGNAGRGTPLHRVNLSTDVGEATEPLNDLKQALVATENCPESDNACLNELIEWLAGRRFAGDPPRDGTESDAERWAFADPMHSRPLVITYGEDGDGAPLSKLFVGTNDGGLRMLNEPDGREGWIFYPHSMLGTSSHNSFADPGKQALLKDNGPRDNGTSKIYGVDGTPVARINDRDGDGVIQPDTDFVHLYFGLRRGGDQLFAVNATPDSTIQSADQPQTPAIKPELLWRIDGNDADFQYLGQTWSTPRPTRILGEDGPRTVLIFGGGYAVQQDGPGGDGVAEDGGDVYNDEANSDDAGNAIFIVDADTGERLWWASQDPTPGTDADSDPDVIVDAMNTAIAAPVTLLDTNGDDMTDRIYAVDLRGQVFRVDLPKPGTTPQEQTSPSDSGPAQSLSRATAGVLARLGSRPQPVDRRKLFYAPSVSRVNDELTGGGVYDLVVVTSGNRVNPQGKTVMDRAYGIRDYLVGEAISAGGDNFPACNPNDTQCQNARGGPIQHGSPEPDLLDVTAQGSFVIRGEDGTVEGDTDVVAALREGYGWFFELEGANVDDDAAGLTGEKGFSAVSVLDGKAFFTTYLPPEEAAGDHACSAPGALGTSRLYAVDVFTGAPAFELFNGLAGFQKTDRFKNLGAGPSADVVPAYLEPGVTLVVPTGGAAVGQDPQVAHRAFKTFWFEER